MTNENEKAPVASEPAAAPTTTTVVMAPTPGSSWLRPLVVAICLVGTLLIGGVGAFLVAHALDGPRHPINIELVGPGQGGGQQGGPDRPQQGRDGEQRPRPNQAPPPADGDNTDGTDTDEDTTPDES